MSIDKFFDALDGMADKVVNTLKDAHHPDKVYDNESAEDAEVVSESVEVILGMHDGIWHMFRGVTNRTWCKRSIAVEEIEVRKRLNGNGVLSRVCAGCLAIAFQTQSSGAVKELGDGR